VGISENDDSQCLIGLSVGKVKIIPIPLRVCAEFPFTIDTGVFEGLIWSQAANDKITILYARVIPGEESYGFSKTPPGRVFNSKQANGCD
jgi:hypothetical protein